MRWSAMLLDTQNGKKITHFIAECRPAFTHKNCVNQDGLQTKTSKSSLRSDRLCISLWTQASGGGTLKRHVLKTRFKQL